MVEILIRQLEMWLGLRSKAKAGKRSGNLCTELTLKASELEESAEQEESHWQPGDRYLGGHRK